MPRKKLHLAVAALAACASALFAAPALAATTLSGAGSTLVAPIEASWARGFQHNTGIVVQYTGVGSGTGITDITNRLVDFGASDAPLTSSQFSACGGCVQVPWALSAVGIGYHLSGFHHQLHLTGKVLAAIYLGQIKRWNDRRITSLNKGVHLPNLAITPVFRSDGSGDTYAFTNYLSSVSGQWHSQVGTGTKVQFPSSANGVGGNGNIGVTSLLESTNGAIAYIAAAYLIGHGQPAAKIKNAAGNYLFPNLPNIIAAGSSAKHFDNNAVSIVNPPAKYKQAYPISTFTYAIVPASSSKGSALKQFISYAIGTGQAFAEGLDFAPLPSAVVNAAHQALNQIH